MKKVKERVKKIANTWFYSVPFGDAYVVGTGKDLTAAYNDSLLKIKEMEEGGKHGTN
ncbi:MULTISPECIES: hypothetical protein [Fusobacterium]|uniref:hypothetical protein n=1 Tax=Fusobacterium TaxID=848 RepID=UPI00164EB288|nr:MULTISPECIES: hypothetical protein [Fusobacterium]